MANYRTAYYLEMVTNGVPVRLNFMRKTDSLIIATRIGDVLASLSYGIQGGDDAVDEPIQQTSLEVSFVDAPEKSISGSKWGDWDVFYTSDATGYKVVLQIDGVTKWTGFITPDSWEEDLAYHAPVSIVARDNWGRLRDFKFDASGDDDALMTVEQLVMQAAQKVGMPMTVVINGAAQWPICNSQPLYKHYININAFEGKTWWDAVYDTLGSLGMCLQYADDNTFVLNPLRARCYAGKGTLSDVPVRDVTFMATGHRSLSPAVNEIVEVQSYDISEDMMNPPPLTWDAFNAGATYPFTTQPFGIIEHNMPVFSLASGGYWKQGTTGYYSLLSQFNYSVRANDDEARLKDDKTIFLACNPGTAEDYSVTPSTMKGVYCDQNMTKMRADITIVAGPPVTLENYEMGTAPYDGTSPSIQYLYAKLRYTTNSGVAYCWNGSSWVNGDAYYRLTPPTNETGKYEYEFVIPSADIDVPGILRIDLKCGGYIVTPGYADDVFGLYMPISDIKLTSVYKISAENKVTTKYSENNNVIIERNPVIGCVNFDTVSPQQVLNGVYQPTVGRPASREWKWAADNKTVQLPVLVHQQLLAYFSKPNNVLTGTLVLDGELPSFNCLWRWRDQLHMLLTGRLNLVTGRMEGVTLRGFLTYEELWG